MLAATADWVRKKHGEGAPAIENLKAEILELMELSSSNPEQFKVALHEKMGIVDEELDIPITGEEILDPDVVQPEPLPEPGAEAVPEPEQVPETSVPEG